jgi:hypothetical protein
MHLQIYKSILYVFIDGTVQNAKVYKSPRITKEHRQLKFNNGNYITALKVANLLYIFSKDFLCMKLTAKYPKEKH